MEPGIVIRPFRTEDAEPTASLIRRTLLVSNAEDYPYDVLDQLAQWYSARGLISRMPLAHRLVAADAAGRLLGTAAVRRDRIEGFFVDPGAQGQGIGAGLLATLESWARAAWVSALRVDSSLTAVAFYERHGYLRDGPRVDLGEGDVVPMRKPLPLEDERRLL